MKETVCRLFCFIWAFGACTYDFFKNFRGQRYKNEEDSEECSPTLMTGAGGNKTAVVQDQRLMESLVLNDQGGKNMDVSVNVTGTLRAQTHGHLPVVFQKSEDEENET